MTVTLHKGDLPDNFQTNFKCGPIIAVDTEAMGLHNHRDRLCVVQLSTGDGTAHLVQFDRGAYDAPNLKKLLADPTILKLFHFARFDVAIIQKYLGVSCTPLWCTRIASTLCRTYTDRHGLRELCRELLGIDLNKQQQSSDWGNDELTTDQLSYAANDVLHLHALKEKLDVMLAREERLELAQKLFDFIPVRAELDLAGWPDTDIFAHTA